MLNGDFSLHFLPSSWELRSYLFFRGYFKAAITSSIEHDPIQKHQETDDIKFLHLKQQVYDRVTGNTFLAFKVEKKYLLYFTSYYGF